MSQAAARALAYASRARLSRARRGACATTLAMAHSRPRAPTAIAVVTAAVSRFACPRSSSRSPSVRDANGAAGLGEADFWQWDPTFLRLARNRTPPSLRCLRLAASRPRSGTPSLPGTRRLRTGATGPDSLSSSAGVLRISYRTARRRKRGEGTS